MKNDVGPASGKYICTRECLIPEYKLVEKIIIIIITWFEILNIWGQGTKKISYTVIN